MEKHPPILEDIYESTFVIILVITMKHCPIWRTTTSPVHFFFTCVGAKCGLNSSGNAPKSLRWFRSDLSQDNIDMLRSERSESEFV